MDFDNVEKISVAVTGAVAALATLGRKIASKIDTFRFMRGLEQWHKLHEAMLKGRDHGAARVVLFGAHNGGGMPRVGSPFFTTAYHWQVEHPSAAATLETIRELPVDVPYIGMCLDLYRRGAVRVTPGEGDDLLSRIYRADGVVDSLIVYLCVKRKTFYYVSFSRHEGRFENNEIMLLELLATTLKKHL